MLTVPHKEGTSYYGELFESFIIIECMKLAAYYYKAPFSEWGLNFVGE